MEREELDELARERAQLASPIISMDVAGHGRFRCHAITLDRQMREYAGDDIIALRARMLRIMDGSGISYLDVCERSTFLVMLASFIDHDL